MKKEIMMMAALASGAGFIAQAQDHNQFNFGDWAKNSFTLFNAERDGAPNPYVQELSLKFRGQFQGAYVDPAGGTDRVKGAADGRDKRDNNEWRRFRIGAQARVFDHFTLKGVWNIGGLDSRYKYKNGQWHRSSTSSSVDEIYIAGKFDPVVVNLGKHKPAYMSEYRTSSAKLITLERSAIVNQLKAEKLYGLSVARADKKATLQWNVGVWANGQRDSNTWLEPSFNSDDGFLLGASLGYATGKKSRLTFDYMHSTRDQGAQHPGTEYAGAGAQDVLALTWETEKNDLSFMAEAMAGFNVYDAAPGGENVYGLVLMPSYRLSPHWEAVVRYQLAAGSNAVASDSRYYTTNGAFSGTCDLQHGLYFGANYYVSPQNPHALKVMFGAEYINSHGTDAAGNKGFTGWQLSTGVRWDF